MINFIILIIFLPLLTVDVRAKIYLLSTEVTFNRVYLLEHRVTIKPDRVSLDSIMNLAQTFPYDPWVKVIISKRNVKTQKYHPLIQTDNNVCHILGKRGSNFMVLWLNNVMKYGNLPKSCPLRKGNYSWCGLNADSISVPNFVTGQYRATIETYFRIKSLREFVANLTVFGEFK